MAKSKKGRRDLASVVVDFATLKGNQAKKEDASNSLKDVTFEKGGWREDPAFQLKSHRLLIKKLDETFAPSIQDNVWVLPDCPKEEFDAVSLFKNWPTSGSLKDPVESAQTADIESESDSDSDDDEKMKLLRSVAIDASDVMENVKCPLIEEVEGPTSKKRKREEEPSSDEERKERKKRKKKKRKERKEKKEKRRKEKERKKDKKSK